jgi:ABC-2 type transport system permease protein
VVVAGRTVLDLYVLPLVLVMVLAFVGVLNMPSFLAYYRKSGILRRLAVTPASPLLVLLAQAIVSAIQAALGILVAAGVAVLAFGANPPLHPWAALGALALTAAAMYAMGMIVAAVAPSPSAGVAIGLIGFLGIGALGGMFGGRDSLPGPLAEVGAHLPFGAGVDALAAAWAGQPLPASALLSLAAAVVVGTVVAAALFRWE